MLSLHMLSHGFTIITLDTFSWKYNKFTRTNASLSLSFNLPSVLGYDLIRYFHAITFECSSILSHEHTLRSKVHCDLVLVLSLNSGAQSLTVTLTPPLHSALQLCTHLIVKYCTRYFSQLCTHVIAKYWTRIFSQLCTHVIAKYCARNFPCNRNFSPKNRFLTYHRNFAQHKVLCT